MSFDASAPGALDGYRTQRDGVIINGDRVQTDIFSEHPSEAMASVGLAQMAITIFDVEVSQWAEDHFSRHRITRDQIYQILENRWISIANRKGRAADYLVIGRDNSGRCIAVPVMPTDDPTVWRPVSAWYCKPSEAAKLR